MSALDDMEQRNIEEAYKRGYQDAINRPHPQCEECHINFIIEQKRGCLTCLNPECPIWQGANQNCWKSQKEHDTTIAIKTREDVFVELEPALQKLIYHNRNIKDFADTFAKAKFKHTVDKHSKH